MSNYKANDVTLGSLLAVTSPRIEVPDYQRSYSWASSDVDAFWSDLISFSDRFPGDNILEHQYFMGAVVLVDQRDHVELLDGQQRVATATILLAAIRDYLAALGETEPANDLQGDFIYKRDHSIGKTVFRLRLNVYDRDCFRQSIQQPSEIPPTASKPGHLAIESASKLLAARLRAHCEQFTAAERLALALRIQRVLTHHVTLVSVVSDDSDEASDVFEVLNDRGIGLSTPDLTRTLLLRRAAESDGQEIVDLWGEILDLGTPPNIDRLLRAYWVTREGDIKQRALYRAIKQKIQDDNLSPLKLTREIHRAAAIYREMIAGRDSDEQMAAVFKAVRELGANSLYPVFIALAFKGDPPERAALGEALVSYYVRHTVIGGLAGSTLESNVYELAKGIASGEGVSDALTKVASWMPNDEEFLQKFSAVHITRVATIRYLLSVITILYQPTAEFDVATTTKVHVEHIYPRKPITLWEDHERWLWRLGNMTLLAAPLNMAIKNNPFGDKKIHYKDSQFNLTNELANLDDWNTDTLEKRQGQLADLALQAWPTPQQEGS